MSRRQFRPAALRLGSVGVLKATGFLLDDIENLLTGLFHDRWEFRPP